jgi:BirA family transcriptional regulator, biotin operon repressor / biotin---[acetyl-CoA-carboxylase] ligase
MTTKPDLSSFYHLQSFAEVDSTNEVAKRRASDGALEGTIIWSRRQDAGRGRRGRVWVSPPGNLYVSIVLRPEGAAASVAQLGFAAALAVGDMISAYLPTTEVLSYKWPNDVLVDGKKISGILLESQAAGEGRVDWLVVGIGVNLASSPDLAEYPATALEEACGRPVTVEAALEAVAQRFQYWYERWRSDGFHPLRVAWLARVGGLGEDIRVRLRGEELCGRFAGLDEEGALLLEQGKLQRRITAGEVFPVVTR